MERYTTEGILRNDKEKLRQVNEAIRSLSSDKRKKSQVLKAKFMELRDNLLESIASNETALKLERKYANEPHDKIVMIW